MTEVNERKKFRSSLFEDTYNNVVPKRVPINVNISIEAVAEFGDLSVRDVLWNPSSVMPAAHSICNQVYSDICPAQVFSPRFPAAYEISQSESFKMGSGGFVQHPEVEGMLVEEYDYLIESPLDCILERVIPRLYKAYDVKEPMLAAINVAKTIAIKNADMFTSFGLMGSLNEQYGYYAENGMARAMTTAPFDYIADQLRSFTGITKDIRRIPYKVVDACEAVYPFMVKAGIPKMITPHSRAYSFLHMPTFMREKHFEKFWWPTFLRMCNEHASMGIQTDTFCEDDWTRYYDYLYELPANSLLKFEYGDAKLAKEKLGKKHILTGFYPLTLLKTGSKQNCVDKAKELIDILAPGGKYIFSFDKQVITANSIKLENLIAVTEFIRDNTNYANAGETAGLAFVKEDYSIEPSRTIESKYYKTKADYAKENEMLTPMASKLQAFDDATINFLINLLF